MPKPNSVKTLTAAIWDLEKAHNLLHKTIAEVKVWQLLRMEIYYALAKGLSIFSEPHAKKAGVIDIVKSAKALPSALLNTPLKGDHTKRILIFDHVRKVKVDGAYVDIHTQPLLDSLSADEVDIIEPICQGKHLTQRTPNRYYLDSLAMGSFFYQTFVPLRFSKEEQLFIEHLNSQILEIFGVDIQLEKRFRNEIKHFKYSYRYYTRLLEKRAPEQIYLVVSYSYYKRPLIAAAKALGIETIEIQHGTLSPYHLGYNFPETPGPLDYFPDKFLTFGDYWRDAAQYPLPKANIQTIGFAHFNRNRARYDHISKIPEQVLVISQGAIGAKLAKFILSALPFLKDKKIIYKLHPGEYERWRDDYPELVEADTHDNVQVVDHNRNDLYAYFASSMYQFGCFSTALYEGLAFGCKTIIIDLPGTEYMDHLCEQDIVQKVVTPSELTSAMAALKTALFDSRFFFGET